MILKRVFILIIMFLSFNIQAQNTEKSLVIGDMMPAFSVPKVMNSRTEIYRISDDFNKLLIVDFWTTGCAACIEAMPKMEALQKKFGSRIKILPVTYEKEAEAVAFWKKNKYTRNLNLPFVVDDKIFSTYFKHKYFPHEIWIDHGKVIGITSSEYVDDVQIQKVLNGDNVNWPVKNDFYHFDVRQPLFKYNLQQIDTSVTKVQYAAISDYKDSVSANGGGGYGIIRDSIRKTVRTYFINEPILSSYFLFWNYILEGNKLSKPFLDLQPNQLIWEVLDKSKYRFEKNLMNYEGNWIRNYGICFESLYPDTGQLDREIYQSAILDMNRLLGLKVRWEKRKEKAIIIRQNSNKRVITPVVNAYQELYSIPGIIYRLNEEENNPYVFDESGDKLTKVPLKISSWRNLHAVSHVLKAYGFDLVEEERIVDKLVFSEIKGGRIIDAQMQSDAKKRKIEQNNNLKSYSNEENTNFLENNKTNPNVRLTKSGLQYKIFRDGNGDRPTLNDEILVNYEGRLINGKIFDSSYETGMPVKINLNDVIIGWKEALPMMREAAVWELYIPAALAYGTHTNSGLIPPNSTLIFKIELLKIISKK